MTRRGILMNVTNILLGGEKPHRRCRASRQWRWIKHNPTSQKKPEKWALWYVPHSYKKEPKTATAILGSGLTVSGLLWERQCVKAYLPYSFDSLIIKGRFKIHISYMGIPNMIRNVANMRISPVSIVTTKKGDT